jgi:hypothetical protein
MSSVVGGLREVLKVTGVEFGSRMEVRDGKGTLPVSSFHSAVDFIVSIGIFPLFLLLVMSP